MSEHLPECREALIPDFENQRWICICNHLRACEQRVREEERARIRQAIEALDIYTHYRVTCEPPGKVDWSRHRNCDPLADIMLITDALRGEHGTQAD